MNKKTTLFFLFVLMVVSSQQTLQATSPPSCQYGTCNAWVSFDGYTWLNTTIDFKELNRGQPFFIKTNITTTRQDILVSMYFYETAVYSTDKASFEIIDGYNKGIINQNSSMIHEFGIIKQPTSFERIWKVKVRENATWWNGMTPLNIQASFNKRDPYNWYNWIGEEIHFTMVNVFINKTSYRSTHHKDMVLSDSEDSSTNHTLNGNYLHYFFFFMILIFIFFKKYKDY